MSGDLISREAAMALARNHIGRTIDCNDIARLPAVDAEPVRHGRWKRQYPISLGGVSWYECSLCKSSLGCSYMNYCPNCGAKMGVEETE